MSDRLPTTQTRGDDGQDVGNQSTAGRSATGFGQELLAQTALFNSKEYAELSRTRARHVGRRRRPRRHLTCLSQRPRPQAQRCCRPIAMRARSSSSPEAALAWARPWQLEFARLGAAVAIASRRPEHRESGIRALEALGAKAIGVELDVRDDHAVRRNFDQVEEQLGPADVLINNAAGNFPSQAVKLSANGWRSVVDIVLNGTFLCSTEFARRAIDSATPPARFSISARRTPGLAAQVLLTPPRPRPASPT